ncbi:MAG: DUF3168 domain-containing protein [Candidatus Babeliales bacterium]|jgi:hypothetical protein
MVIEEALLAYLLAQSGLTALVSNRIHFLKLPQTPTLPAVTLQKIDSTKIPGFSADIGAMTRIQTTSWALTYTGVSAVQEQIRAATQNYMNQTMGSTGGVPVKNIELDEGPDSYEDDTGRFGKVIDLLIYHTEA